MDLLGALGLSLSGAMVASSVILFSVGFSRGSISRKTAAIMGGVGVGLGAGGFVFLGVSHRDLVGSVVVSIIAALAGGIAMYVSLKSKG